MCKIVKKILSPRLLLFYAGKFKSDVPVVTENFLGADTLIVIALFCTFSIVSVTFFAHSI